MIEFRILKKSKKSRGRLGVLKTPHGEIETPCLVPVATQAVVKTLTSEEVADTKTQILIANTYHLHEKPGEGIVKAAGGLHRFMNWQRPLMTDSGGFQVFSFGFGRDLGVGKMLFKRRRIAVRKGDQPDRLKITDKGVWFSSPDTGRKIFLNSKESLTIQQSLGADIMFAFDECTPPLADYAYTKKSLGRTHRWARESLEARESQQALYGIVQGGRFKDLRIESARFIGSLGFDGIGIGGEFGYEKRKMNQVLDWVIPELPKKLPRHLLGIGHPEDLEPVIRQGVDTFDCIAPAHYARRGVVFTSSGRLDITKQKFLKDKKSLDPKCACSICHRYSRSYICHLFRAKEITGMRLATFHNLWFFHSYVESLRNKIKRGVF